MIKRILSRFISSVLVGALLFAQITVAAHACSGEMRAAMGGAAGAVAMMPGASMVGMEADGAGLGATDAAQPQFCAAHCQSGQQNAGVKVGPDLPAAVPVSLYPLRSVVCPLRPLRLAAPASDPPPLAELPHAIAHCCLRI